MFRLSRKHARPAGVERTWAACSLLLDYPTEELLADRGLKPSSHSATLRGIANEVSIYAIP